jgi:hypothetical protein
MRVKIIEPTEHDGKPLELGAVADLPKEAALALIACKSAVLPDADKASKREAKAPAGGKAPAGAADGADAADGTHAAGASTGTDAGASDPGAGGSAPGGDAGADGNGPAA